MNTPIQTESIANNRAYQEALDAYLQAVADFNASRENNTPLESVCSATEDALTAVIDTHTARCLAAASAARPAPSAAGERPRLPSVLRNLPDVLPAEEDVLIEAALDAYSGLFRNADPDKFPPVRPPSWAMQANATQATLFAAIETYATRCIAAAFKAVLSCETSKGE